MAKSSTCSSLWCAHTNYEALPKCPRCGRRTVSSGQIRVYGAILVFLGTLLCGGMLFLAAWLAPYMLHPGESRGGTRFTGTPEQAMMIFGVFGLVGALGFGFALAGIWQLITGSRSKWVGLAALVIAFGIVIVSWVLEIYTEFF